MKDLELARIAYEAYHAKKQERDPDRRTPDFADCGYYQQQEWLAASDAVAQMISEREQHEAWLTAMAKLAGGTA